MTLLNYSFSNKIDLVKTSLITVIKKFFTNPENYFYEEQIRSLLYNNLFDSFEEAGIVVQLNGKDYFNEYKSKPINPVKAEYGKDSGYYSKYDISNMDIAILSEESLFSEELNDYQRYCDIVIELKYSTEKCDSQHAGFVGDVEKIRNAKQGENFLGLALCFDLFEVKDNYLNKFLNDYTQIKFRESNIDNIVFQSGNCYAVYVSRNKLFISQPLNK